MPYPWLRGRDLNTRMRESKSRALPLGDHAMKCKGDSQKKERRMKLEVISIALACYYITSSYCCCQ